MANKPAITNQRRLKIT